MVKKIGKTFQTLSKKTHGFWQSLFLASLIGTASTVGFFSAVDGFMYDSFVRNTPSFQSANRQVVLIDVPVARFSTNDVDWETLIDRATGMGARQVVFTIAPTLNFDRLARILNRKNVIVGEAIKPDRDNLEDNVFVSAPLIGNLTFPAVSAISDRLFGIHRYQQYSFPVIAVSVPTLEALAARRLGIDVPNDGQFMVNFAPSQSRLPRMTLDQVLEGGLIREIVQGRVVLFGPALGRMHRDVVTPITAGARQVSELEYHGYALDSLLRNAAIMPLWTGAPAVVALLMWSLCFLLVQARSFRQGMVIVTLMAVAFCGFAWLALAWANVHVPVAAGLLVLGTTLVSVFQRKGQRQNRQLSQLVNETTLIAGAYEETSNVVASGNFWPHVMAMLDQMLPLTRAALLARSDQPGLASLVQTLRCDRDVIKERRRDYRRTPYSTALDQNGPVVVRGYLKDGHDREVQLLVPLSFAGQVLGFLALGVPKTQTGDMPALMRTAVMVSEHLSELMLEYSKARERDTAVERWQKNLRDPRDEAVSALSRNVRLISRRIIILQDMVNSLDAATAVYDLFGRTLFVNARMKQSLAKAGVDGSGHTAADLLVLACAMTLDEARSVITRVVLDRHSFERTGSLGDQPILLMVSALQDTAVAADAALDPLENIHGIMFQFFLNSTVAKREIRRVDSITRVSGVLEDALVSLHEIAAGPVQPQIGRISNLLASATQGEEGTLETEPVDVWHALELAVGLVRSDPRLEQVAFNLEGDRSNVTTAVLYGEFELALAALLRLLAEDTRDPGSVTIAIGHENGHVTIEMRNNGFGMPDEKLQSMLTGPKLPQLPALRLVRQLRSAAFGEEGQFSLFSEVGSGYVCRIVLPTLDPG